MKPLRILFSCAGRRNYLIKRFKDALGPNGGQILATDASEHAAAFALADERFIMPPLDAPDYTDVLQDLCRRESVDLLVPLNDVELPLLAERRASFAEHGTLALVSSPEVIKTCFDKYESAQFLAGLGLKALKTFVKVEDASASLEEGEITLPVMVKPRFGSGSIGLQIVKQREDLAPAVEFCRKAIDGSVLALAEGSLQEEGVIIQQFAPGREHGFDIVNTLQGDFACVFSKLKLGMRAGETDKATTVDAAPFVEMARTLSASLKHIGNLDLDVFVGPEGSYVLEMNPRFGGGYPFSHAAGANIPAAIVAWLRGEEADPSWLTLTPGVTSAKCDDVAIL